MTDTATVTQSKHWSQCQQPCWGTNTALASLLPVSLLHPQHQAALARSRLQTATSELSKAEDAAGNDQKLMFDTAQMLLPLHC